MRRLPPRWTSLATSTSWTGPSIYRVVAYREAAKSIRDSPVSVAQLAREGRATELRNVGKTLEEKIRALLETGDIPAAVKLRSKFPGELVRFTRLPGLGAKTARRIHAELGISTLEELRHAAEQERLRSVPGIGPKAEQNIARALYQLEEEGPAERLLLSAVLTIGEEIVEHLRSHPAADRVEIAGSARRMTDTCKDLDIIATADDPAALTQAFTEMQLLARSVRAGRPGRGASRTTASGSIFAWSSPTSTETCSSISPAPSSTTWSCASTPCAGGCT